MKAIGFDLGNTLLSSGKVPLSWQSHYRIALNKIVSNCGVELTEKMLLDGERLLSKYNTRVNYREEEVPSDRIFGELLAGWGLPADSRLEIAKETFFGHFQQKAALFDDVVPALRLLKSRGYRIGILTDVPYGMDKRLVERDLVPISEYVDSLVTSVEVGFRKPDPRGFLELARQLETDPKDMAYIGDEEKDIVGANRVGMCSVYMDRKGTNAAYGQTRSIRSLAELMDWV